MLLRLIVVEILIMSPQRSFSVANRVVVCMCMTEELEV